MANQQTEHLNAFETTLGSAMNTTTTSMSLASLGALAAPCWLVIDKDDPAKREFVLVSAVGSPCTVTRYQSGSAAGSGISHDSGATVHLTPTKQSFDDLHDRVEGHTHDGTSLGGVAVSHDDLSDVSIDDHHARDHASTHHSGGADPMDHGSMAGLGDDDHTIYLKADGTRALTGDVDMGGNAVTNVGNVDGVDVSALETVVNAHASRHEASGADPLDVSSLLHWEQSNEETGGGLTTAYATKHTVTFTKPAGWTTYTIIGKGFVLGSAPQPGRTLQARCTIGGTGNAGTTVELKDGWTGTIQATHKRTGLSAATVDVDIDLREVGGDCSWHSVSIEVLAFMES